MTSKVSQWRIILDGPKDAFLNMAIDEAIFEAVSSQQSPPTIRFYQWERPGAVSIGQLQSIEDINQIQCARDGVAIVRRPTGGRAVFHTAYDITYSVIAPNGFFDPDYIPNGRINAQAYRHICGWIISALQKAGIYARFVEPTSIYAEDCKISGNAQVSGKKEHRYYAMLQHGCLFIDVSEWPRYIHDEKLTGVAGILQIAGEEAAANIQALLHREFTQNEIVQSAKRGHLTLNETRRSLDLVQEYQRSAQGTGKKLVKGSCITDPL